MSEEAASHPGEQLSAIVVDVVVLDGNAADETDADRRPRPGIQLIVVDAHPAVLHRVFDLRLHVDPFGVTSTAALRLDTRVWALQAETRDPDLIAHHLEQAAFFLGTGVQECSQRAASPTPAGQGDPVLERKVPDSA
jgi:hypothetical protein